MRRYLIKQDRWVCMKFFKKVLAALIALIIILEILALNVLAFTDTCQQLPPRMVRVEGQDGQTEPPIGYNEYDGYYVDLRFDAIFPVNPEQPVIGRFLNFYSQPIEKPYRQGRSTVVTELNVPVPAEGMSYRRMKGFSSGTIYYIDVAAYHSHRTESGEIVNSLESVRQPVKLKVLTDIEIEAYTYGSHELRIVWDDVWDVNRRIDYRIYVSETKDFANTPPVYINQNDIGPGKTVTVNEATGKLEYIHKVRDPGRVYYIKIVPDIQDSSVKCSPQTKVVEASSYILVKTTKVSSTETGTVWRLDWSPVVTGLGDSDIKISYQIYRGVPGTTDVPQYIASASGTTFFINQPVDDVGYYYIIRAVVTKDGENVYRNVTIMSDRIIVKEDEIPAVPPAPEIVDEFARAPGDYIIRFQDNLTPTSAILLWRAPLKGDGTLDRSVTYNIWLVTDPSMIDNPPQSSKIASNVSMTQYNQVLNGTAIVGYKYGLTNLIPNTTYYIKIVARKVFIDIVDGQLKEVTYESAPSVKIVVTPAEGRIYPPLIPERPPFMVKKDLQGQYMIGSNFAVLQVRNLWYEKYSYELDRWVFVETNRKSANDIPDYDPVANPPDNINYRVVEYDNEIKLDVGCIKYVDGMTADDIRTLIASTEPEKKIDIPLVPNDPWEDPKLNAPYETNPNVYKKHNVDILIDGLEPNTSYIVWVRAVRRRSDIVSGPSEPIIITTGPELTVPPEKPVVPVFTYGFAGDTYIDISWNYRPGYNYNIRYGTVDNINSAKQSIRVKYEDIRFKSFYRVEGLQPATTYYFWIQAEFNNESGNTAVSDWSDSLVVRTLDYLPPPTPLGFGVKNIPDAISKNSVMFEWLIQENMEYVLEIATNMEYRDPVRITLGNVSEYLVEDLRSNTRYFARLYAYDPVKNLMSEPTQSVVVRTKRSYDDYDSDQDTDKVITGDFIEKGSYPVNGKWIVRVTGVNADRFIEYMRTDNRQDYVIELMTMPEGASCVSIAVSQKLFKALDTMKENIEIITAFCKITIRPGMFDSDIDRFLASRYKDYEYILEVGRSSFDGYENIDPLDKPFYIEISARAESTVFPVDYLATPMGVGLTTAGNQDLSLSGVYFRKTGSNRWENVGAQSLDYVGGRLQTNVDITEPGHFIQATERAKEQYKDLRGHVYEQSVKNVLKNYILTSLPGAYFLPDAKISAGEAVKIIMDILKADYNDNYMNMAVRSKIMTKSFAAEDYCTREAAIAMAVRLYELKKGTLAIPAVRGLNLFSDMDKVSEDLLERVEFALQNGIMFNITGNELKPRENLTRAEFMVLVERTLALCGEL